MELRIICDRDVIQKMEYCQEFTNIFGFLLNVFVTENMEVEIITVIRHNYKVLPLV